MDDEDDFIEDENIDLSEFSYAEFLTFFFARPVVESAAAFDLFHSGYCYFQVANPLRVIEHLSAMCSHFSEVARTYTPEQLEQGTTKSSSY